MRAILSEFLFRIPRGIWCGLNGHLDKSLSVPGGGPQGEAADWCIKRESPLDVRLHNYDLVPRAFSLKKWVGREKALCEKLKLCVTSRRAILGGLLYLLTINETFYKISFLSKILAMVIFCFPLISMKGTASNIWKTSVYLSHMHKVCTGKVCFLDSSDTLFHFLRSGPAYTA